MATNILDNSNICDDDLIESIKLIHVFDDIHGYNIIYVTNDDQAYGMGTNVSGKLGLGHGQPVNTPTIIPELCDRGITQFIIGDDFVIALTSKKNVHTWGRNGKGQLARFPIDDNYQLPNELAYFNGKNVCQISCGNYHALALTGEGLVYGWGYNNDGEVGCGVTVGPVTEPQKLQFEHHQAQFIIKSIYCSEYCSFAITMDGLVFSWGMNQFSSLGHGSTDNISMPRLILEMDQIKCVCSSTFSSYFLSTEGVIYFCGQYVVENGERLSHDTLVVLNGDGEINDLKILDSLKNGIYMVTAVMNQKVYEIGFDIKLHETDFSDCEKYYLRNYNKTYTTINLDNHNDFNFNTKREYLSSYKSSLKTIFADTQTLLSDLAKIDPLNGIMESIKLFHVFDDERGYNVIFITSDDMAYGYGSNQVGLLGFDHNVPVTSPQLIPGLCDQKITQFIPGLDFILAVNSDKQILGWGHNNMGQLARRPVDLQQAPNIIRFFNDKNVTQLSCGYIHAMALTHDGSVYGWGCNTSGQIGCGYTCDYIAEPTLLQFRHDGREYDVKTIYSSGNSVFAITEDNSVFSWGLNDYFNLGHNSTDIYVNSPRLVVDISNVSSVCSRGIATLFLTHDGDLYLCGRYVLTDGDEYLMHKTLKRLPNYGNVELIKHVFSWHNKIWGLVASINGVICDMSLKEQFYHSTHRSIFEYYITKLKITHATICYSDFCEYDYESKEQFIEYCLKYLNEILVNVKQMSKDNRKFDSNTSPYITHYEQLSKIGSGSFGTVYKVKQKYNQLQYAIKIVGFKANSDLQDLSKEAEKLVRVRSEFVVQYNDFWVESDRMFVQMELCSRNLQKILDSKPNVFGREPEEPMNAMEYYMSCLIMWELLECLQYLHGLSPPVIHRDLKPENILIAIGPRNGRFFKVGDFGLATINEHYSEKGNPKYLAPEVNNESLYTYKIDIYSLSRICELDIFEFDIDALDNGEMYSSGNEVLSKCVVKLRDVLVLMQSDDPDIRPECKDVLQTRNEWELDLKYVRNDPEYESMLTMLNEYDDKFFIEYFNAKIATNI